MISSFVTIKDLPTFDKLIDESRFHISSPVSLGGEEKVSKMKNKYNLLTIIDNGYRSLPKPYHEAFLDPLKNLILTQDFGSILNTYGGGEATLLEDWIACIDQRSRKFSRKKTDDLSAQTMAFTELCADIYDGYVSRSVRKDALLPESQLLAPLTKWGGTGAYTHSVRAGIGIGMKASIINLPIQYSKNIALWPLSVHECYHDVVEAYGGLLNEVEDRISEEFESAKMRKAFKRRINWNGEKDLSISEFAAEYWRRTMSETLADICGVLNIGPAGGISFAVLALAQGSKDIVPKSYIDDPHPNDVLRVRIAVEVIRHFKGLALNIREAYVAFLNQLIEKYVNEKNYLVLYL